MKRGVLSVSLAALLLASTAAEVSADPGATNPVVQYRTFSCDDGNSYTGGFAGGAAGTFFIVDSTSVFAIKTITLAYPSGQVSTYNYGIPGFDPNTLVTCQYTDPQGVVTTFSGWLTPRSS